MSYSLTAIFDLDGTLTDSRPGIMDCLTRTLDAHGIPWTGPLDWFIGPPAGYSFQRLMPDSDESFRRKVLLEYRACYSQTGWTGNSVYGGVPELLASLQHAKFQLFVCTSKREDFARKILSHFQLQQYFSALYADKGQTEDHSKSELVERLIREQSIDPSATFIIGDRRFDIEAGCAHGLQTIGVTYGYGTPEELSAAQPDIVCHSPKEVGEALLAHAHLTQTAAQ